MLYCHIECGIKEAAIKLYECGLISLKDILDVLEISQWIFFQVWRLYHETGSIVAPKNPVKKHQQKSGDAYKAANLEAVKKHQEMSGAEYKASHLKAVQMHQEKSGDAYRASHLDGVKRHQGKLGDGFRKANLEAVKKYQDKNREKYTFSHQKAASKFKKQLKFPPSSPSLGLQHSIISETCEDMAPHVFVEAGCAVCGRLTSLSSLLDLSEVQLDLNLLISSGVTQQERLYAEDPIKDLEDPILEDG